jgi:hypothetical protein
MLRLPLSGKPGGNDCRWKWCLIHEIIVIKCPQAENKIDNEKRRHHEIEFQVKARKGNRNDQP